MTATRLLVPLLLALGPAAGAIAQAPPASNGGGRPSSGETVSGFSDPYMSAYSPRHSYRSRTAPQPPPHNPEGDYGFRNPGGVGRFNEFYGPGTLSQVRGTDPVRVATFGGGPSATSRQSQMQAQRVGNDSMRTLNAHIDAYARPLGGFGYGYGFGGYGYGLGFPY